MATILSFSKFQTKNWHNGIYASNEVLEKIDNLVHIPPKSQKCEFRIRKYPMANKVKGNEVTIKFKSIQLASNCRYSLKFPFCAYHAFSVRRNQPSQAKPGSKPSQARLVVSLLLHSQWFSFFSFSINFNLPNSNAYISLNFQPI